MSSTLLASAAVLLLAAAEPPAPGYQPGYSVPAPPLPANGAIFQTTNGYAPLTSGQLGPGQAEDAGEHGLDPKPFRPSLSKRCTAFLPG